MEFGAKPRLIDAAQRAGAGSRPGGGGRRRDGARAAAAEHRPAARPRARRTHHPGSAAAGFPRGHPARRGRPRDGSGCRARPAPRSRRAARRGCLRRGRAVQRLHPAASRRGRAGERADRGVGLLRRRARLRRRPAVGVGARVAVDRQHPATRLVPASRQRPLPGGFRHVLRSPQRGRVPGDPDRRLLRLRDQRRGQPEPGLECRVGRAGRPLRRGLDDRDAHSLQVPALPPGRGADLGGCRWAGASGASTRPRT